MRDKDDRSAAALRTFFLSEEALHLLDQRALPDAERWLALTSVDEVAEAIETLAVRGAPAIGGAAAMALVLVARDPRHLTRAALREALLTAIARLRTTRPTAVNLFVALDRITRICDDQAHTDVEGLRRAVIAQAQDVVDEDAAACAAIGAHGAPLFDDGDVVLTICHTGALATCGQGTALGVLKSAQQQGKRIRVIALETRPLLQGARLTAWECLRTGLDVTLITDGMAAFALERQGVTKAIVGADRIAVNGDVANKIGTLGLARLCQVAHVPFYVAAPTSTFDPRTASGAQIPIEERHPDEVRAPRGHAFAPATVSVWNPAFDVTPAACIAGIITERGVWQPGDRTWLAEHLA